MSADKQHDLDARLAEGVKAHQSGDGETAFAAYTGILEENPQHADALHFLGMLVFDKDKPEDAIGLIRQSLAIEGRNASAHNNLANIFSVTGRSEEALSEYMLAAEFNPDLDEVWKNIGVLAASVAEPGDLLPTFLELTRRHDGRGEPWRLYGQVLMRDGRKEEAADAFDKALTAGVETVRTAVRVARYLHELEGGSRSVAHMEKLVIAFPEDANLAFQLAALRGDEVSAAPEDYVRSHFDGFADSFDEVLNRLDYNTPEQVARDVRELAAGRGSTFPDAVDLGCGTGLCGPLVRDLCGVLSGLDLSNGMLQKAAQRGCYDYLVEGELVAFLNADLPTQFDLAVCVDTLCYLGDLEPFFDGMKTALKPGGVLVASVELLDDDGGTFHLQASGRYAHASGYLKRTVGAAGLVYARERTVVLRKEFGRPVNGVIFQVFKPSQMTSSDT